MTKRSWNFALGGVPHSVVLTHGYFSGRRSIALDGRLLPLDPNPTPQRVDFGSKHPFRIGYHQAVVIIRTNGLSFSYDLVIDGRSVESGLPIDPETPTIAMPRQSLDRLIAAIIAFSGLALLLANWYLLHRYALYSLELAFLGPFLLIMAAYIPLFGDDLHKPPSRLPARVWLALALAIAAGAANSYALSRGLY